MKKFFTAFTAALFGTQIAVAVQEINTSADFDAFIQSHELVVVDFYAPWCPPCKKIAPIFANLSEQETYKAINFIKVNVDEGGQIATKHSVTAMPTFLFFKKGTIVNRVVGAKEQDIRNNLSALLK